MESTLLLLCGELLHCETNAICGETFLWELLMPAIVKPLCFLHQMIGWLHISVCCGPIYFCHRLFFPTHWSNVFNEQCEAWVAIFDCKMQTVAVCSNFTTL